MHGIKGIRSAIACIVVVCATDGLSVFAMSNPREQCFAKKDPVAQETCRSYIEKSAFKVSDIISLGRELEEKLLYANAVVVYKQGLRLYPDSKELLKQLHMAESFIHEGMQKTTLDTGVRDKRFDIIQCTQLQGAKALDACQRAIALDPANDTLRTRLGEVRAALNQSNAPSTPSVQPKVQPKQDVPSKPPATVVPSPSVIVPPPEEASPSSSPKDSKTVLAQLQLLDDLKSKRLISLEDYEKRKEKLLDTALTLPVTQPSKQSAQMDNDRTVLADVKLGNFYALVIGNNDYKNIPKLQSAIADVKAVETLLTKEYGFRVTPLINANRNQILSELAGFRTRLSERDSFLIYYAGHGVRDEDIQRGYWLPIDAEAKNPANWLSTTDIIDQVNGMKALHVLVVADSCFSATLLRSGISGFDRANDQSNPDRYALIRRLAKKRSRTVLTSGGNEPVLDSGGGQYSVFAKAFLNTLQENQGIMEGSRLFQKLRELVVDNADQTPEYAPAQKAGHEGGDFIFIRQP